MKLLTGIVLGLAVSGSALAQSQLEVNSAWEGFSAPEIMSSGFTHSLNELPLEGSAASGTKGWSGHYWPSNKNSINNRWNSPRKETFKYDSPSRAAVMSLSQEALATLSPSEKYDLFLGRYDYPTKTEAAQAGSKRAEEWAGICHGWAPAANNHNEPTPKVLTNPDGLQIPFGSADIKALLSYYYAFYTEDQDTDQIGLRCFFGSWLGGMRGCNNDLNAGALHIVMANKLGLQKESFVMDRDRFNEVWNQPVVGYKSTVLNAYLPKSSRAAKNAVREMRVETELYYVDESEPSWTVDFGTKNQIITTLKMVYRLEISADGKIVGGEWETDDRPDFLWNKTKVTNFQGIFSRLPELLND